MKKNTIVSLFVIFLCVQIYPLVGMDLPCNEHMVDLKLLDDKDKIYPIALWKVMQESNLLCQSYGEQKQASIINISGINEQEISLFDKALNATITKTSAEMSFSDYFKKLSPEERIILTIAAGKRSDDGIKKLNAERLSYQLFDEFIHADLSKALMLEHSSEYKKICDYLLASIIADNIHNGDIKTEDINSFDPILAKELPGGMFKFMPPVAQLTTDNFHGKTDHSFFEYEDSQYRLKSQIKTSDNGVLALTTAKIENGSYVENKICLWQINPDKLLKIIQHDAKIYSASFSSNGKWLVSCSNKNQQEKGKLLLTCLDPLSDDYLIDKDLLQNEDCNFWISPYLTACFNHTSTLLARSYGNNIKLFDLTTGEFAAKCNVEGSFVGYVENVCFNKNGDRLITYSNYGDYSKNSYDDIVTLWDISNVKAIKKIKKTTLSSIRLHSSGDSTITLSDAHPDVVAISLYHQTFFFNLCSGECYSRCAKQDWSHDVIALIPFSTVACIGMNKKNGTSCVKVYNFSKADERGLYGDKSQKGFSDCIGELKYNEKKINGLGITTDLRHLIATFDNMLFAKTELYSDDDFAAYLGITKNIKWVDLYLLFHLLRAKEQGCSFGLHDSERHHVCDHLAVDEKGKKLIKKYFF